MASALSVASLIGWVRSPSRRDVALAAVLAAGAVVGAATHGYTGLEAAGLGLLCLPLAVRTRWPLAVLAAVAAAGRRLEGGSGGDASGGGGADL